MEKRTRSPNYPAVSLPDAIQKVTAIYGNLHTHAAPREDVAKAMGYNSLNGASATAISALHKYGLLQRDGEEIKISDRAMRILHPQSPEERATAIREAGSEPELFRELAERFPGRLPNEELLRNYLVRRGFAPPAASHVILAYRETSELVDRETGAYGTPATTNTAEAPMQPSVSLPPSMFSGKYQQIQDDSREVGRYNFEGGAFVSIRVGGGLSTEEALDMIETLIELKRKEIKRGKQKATNPESGQREPEKDTAI